ncbi:hypothetical protein PV733_15485 [Streptomyces europaeiscabiei]|uniref:hypothetical protein n=1 Tax=Streptomyces europaeiscabiei TaxID=146819 RepID=UPI0029AB07C0|nr:hypothetical protein [Streptomyces europaeiscabiei]MDX3710339.1 hypothetical protein [Streptomyces europaeiscabiei]
MTGYQSWPPTPSCSRSSPPSTSSRHRPPTRPCAARWPRTTYRSTSREHPPNSAPPCSLAELGVTERDFDEITVQAQAQPYANPRPVTDEALRTLLADALNGALAP